MDIENVKNQLDDVNDNFLDRTGKRSLLKVRRKSKRWTGHISRQGAFC